MRPLPRILSNLSRQADAQRYAWTKPSTRIPHQANLGHHDRAVKCSEDRCHPAPRPEFLEISYPTTDLLSAIEAIGPKNDRPVVFIGERGQGKSHLMAVLYHALTDQSATQAWLDVWASRLQYPKMATLPLRQGMYVITESLVHQNYNSCGTCCWSGILMALTSGVSGKAKEPGRPTS